LAIRLRLRSDARYCNNLILAVTFEYVRY